MNCKISSWRSDLTTFSLYTQLVSLGVPADLLSPLITEEKARLVLRILSKRFTDRKVLKESRTACGIDVAYSGEKAVAVATTVDLHSANVVEQECHVERASFPYVPALLSFREGPIVCSVFRKLTERPDILILNGHGIAHPYRCGLATFVGIVLSMPSIGVARNILYGNLRRLRMRNCLVDNDGQIIGEEIVSNGKKLYVSVGNSISLGRAVRLVRSTLTTNSTLPAPLALADRECRRTLRSLAAN